MRSHPMTLVVLALLAGASACASADSAAPATEDPATSAVRAALAAAWRDHIDAAKRKDAEAVVQIYADDVVYAVPGAPETRGRAAIDAMEARTLAENDLLDAVHTTDGLRVSGDVAYEIGTVVGPIRPLGEAAATVTFHFMALWRREPGGAWRIAHFVGRPE